MIGGLIFAQNNSNINYVKLAVFAASRIHQYLKIPVSLVTDSQTWVLDNYPNHGFDKIIELSHDEPIQYRHFYDGSLDSVASEWKNLSRHQVYDLSPYEYTLVIDSDYIINSSVLSNAFNRPYELQIYKQSIDLAGWRTSPEFTRINQYSIPFYWATVFFFRKTPTMKAFFDLITYVKDNWQYFRILYNIESTLFRNDFAFSIVIHMMNGKTAGEFGTELPGKMSYCTDKDLLIKMSDDKMQLLLEKEGVIGEYTVAKTTGIDVHFMNKASLIRCIDGANEC